MSRYYIKYFDIVSIIFPSDRQKVLNPIPLKKKYQAKVSLWQLQPRARTCDHFN